MAYNFCLAGFWTTFFALAAHSTSPAKQHELSSLLPLISDGSAQTEPRKIRGNSPAYYCSDPVNDIFQIERLDIFPMPPVLDHYVNVRIWGQFRTETQPGSIVIHNSTVNGTSIMSYTFPLCDTFALDVWQPYEDDIFVGGRSCPPKEGFAEIIYSSFLFTQYFKHGNYTERAEFVTADGQSLFCATGWLEINT